MQCMYRSATAPVLKAFSVLYMYILKGEGDETMPCHVFAFRKVPKEQTGRGVGVA